MQTRDELFLTAVDVLSSGRSLDIEGEHGCGRTHLLTRIRDYFTALGWKTITVEGQAAFVKTPLIALALAGFGVSRDTRAPSIPAVVDALAEAVIDERTIIVVDDGVDSGPILAQERVPVSPDDTEQTLHERIKPVERRLLIDTVRRIATGDLDLTAAS